MSWLAVALGCIVGFVACATFGMVWVPPADQPAWYLAWLDVAGAAVLGLGFLFASLVAVRNRRSAGMIFLAIMPVAGFFLAYPNAGYLVWRADGGYFETPIPIVAIGLAVLFYAVFLVPFLFWPRKKRAAIAFVSMASIGGLIFAYSRWTVALLPRLAGWSLPFLLLGLFWLRTYKLGWPSLVRPRPESVAKRVLHTFATCAAVFGLIVCFTLNLCALRSSLFSGNCRGRPPSVRPLSPTHAVFTAKILFAGRSMEALVGAHGHLPSSGDRKVGEWAIGFVQERFWGMPHWTRLVLLTNYPYWEGETYFLDGGRAQGVLTQFLPIVQGGAGCGRTKPAQNAVIDLRVLRKLPAEGATRVLGYVRGPEPFMPAFSTPTTPNFVAGAQIEVTGPAYSRTVKTDSTGVYELDDLAPGDYTLRLKTPETQAVGLFDFQGSPAGIHLDKGAVVERNFELFWNGRIEGQVQEDGGKPANASVELLSADGGPMPGYVIFSHFTAKDGSYQFRKVPPGRYMVLMNAYGPDGESPYDLQYYPSGVRKGQARVFELAAGQQIAGADFQVQRLAERSSQVRVKWANGSAAGGAGVFVAYENTDDYESLIGRGSFVKTDQNGLALIHTYGKSKVRLFAEQSVYHDNPQWPDHIRSRPVQFAADQIPNTIGLVLNSQNRK